MPLYVVATPIGNLGDLSERAKEALAKADLVVAEDTRRTLGLLSHLGLRKPLSSLPAFDEGARVGPLRAKLLEGQTLALVTDAGTPGISDPGALVVEAAWAAGAKIIPIPGPSALVTALSCSGFDTSRFYMAGFLPRKGGARTDVLAEFTRLSSAIALFEAGNRLAGTLEDLAATLGPRRALVGRELTKLHEELARDTLPTLAERFRDGAIGEVVVVVEGGVPAAVVPEKPLEDEIRDRIAAGQRPTDVARELAKARDLPRQDVYAKILAMKGAD